MLDSSLPEMLTIAEEVKLLSNKENLQLILHENICRYLLIRLNKGLNKDTRMFELKSLLFKLITTIWTRKTTRRVDKNLPPITNTSSGVCYDLFLKQQLNNNDDNYEILLLKTFHCKVVVYLTTHLKEKFTSSKQQLNKSKDNYEILSLKIFHYKLVVVLCFTQHISNSESYRSHDVVTTLYFGRRKFATSTT